MRKIKNNIAVASGSKGQTAVFGQIVRKDRSGICIRANNPVRTRNKARVLEVPAICQNVAEFIFVVQKLSIAARRENQQIHVINRQVNIAVVIDVHDRDFHVIPKINFGGIIERDGVHAFKNGVLQLVVENIAIILHQNVVGTELLYQVIRVACRSVLKVAQQYIIEALNIQIGQIILHSRRVDRIAATSQNRSATVF